MYHYWSSRQVCWPLYDYGSHIKSGYQNIFGEGMNKDTSTICPTHLRCQKVPPFFTENVRGRWSMILFWISTATCSFISAFTTFSIPHHRLPTSCNWIFYQQRMCKHQIKNKMIVIQGYTFLQFSLLLSDLWHKLVQLFIKLFLIWRSNFVNFYKTQIEQTKLTHSKSICNSRLL